MLWLDSWHPRPFLYGLSLICLPFLLVALLRRRPLVTLPGNLPVAVAEYPRASAVHGLLVALAMLMWALSLVGANLNRMAGLGLLDALPPTYFVALGLLLVSFARAVTREKPDTRLLAIHTLCLLLILYGTIPLLYDESRFPWSYKHFGVVNLISSTGTVNRTIDIYNNWPAFFAANGWLSSVSSWPPVKYALGSQLFFNTANAAAVLLPSEG